MTVLLRESVTRGEAVAAASTASSGSKPVCSFTQGTRASQAVSAESNAQVGCLTWPEALMTVCAT